MRNTEYQEKMGTKNLKYLMVIFSAASVSPYSYAADYYSQFAKEYSVSTALPIFADFEKWDSKADEVGKFCHTAAPGETQLGYTLVRSIKRSGEIKLLVSPSLFIPTPPVERQIRYSAFIDQTPSTGSSPNGPMLSESVSVSNYIGIMLFHDARKESSAPRDYPFFFMDMRKIGEQALSKMHEWASKRDQNIDKLYDSSKTEREGNEMVAAVDGFYSQFTPPTRFIFRKNSSGTIYFRSLSNSKPFYAECR